jgi:phage gp46-like protein
LTDRGDVLLFSTLDGGEINVESGIVEMTDGFETAVYLSLAGGNKKDDGTESTKKYEWWGNKLESNNPERKLTSRFQNILFGFPATPANLKKIEAAGKQDLEWMFTDKIADSIVFESSLPEKNRLEVKVVILKDDSKLFETKFSLNWRVGN